MPLEDDFGDIIAKARVGKGLTAAQLAFQAGLAERDVQAIESYQLVPGRDIIGRLCAVLGLYSSKLAAIAEQNWTPRPPDLSTETMMLKSVAVPYGPYGENAYVIGCVRTRMAGVVDPGGAIDKINAFLRDQSLILSTVLITHAHGDHIGGLKDLLKGRAGITVASSPLERDTVMREIDARWHGAEDGAPLNVGELAIKALATPGHTTGSTCYAGSGFCFVGDTLFAGSIGRPGSAQVYPGMLAAIGSKILSLPDSTALLPGHGPVSTVGQEKEHNPFF